MTRIMIVDDKENDRYMLEVLLKGYGYEVTGARNGAEALELARKEPPDVFISDIMMPVMDGFSMCRELKADESLKTIPVIFYTATYTSQKDEELARNLGAEEYIVKPQEPDSFVAKLRNIIEERLPPVEYAQPPLGEEMEFFRQHNKVLFRKLEKKMAELQKAYETALLEITRRKQAEEALKKSEARYRMIVDTANEGIWMFEEELKTTFVNARMAEMIGYRTEEMIGRPMTDFMFEEDEPDHHIRMENRRRGLSEHYERRYRHKNGHAVWTLVSAVPILNAGQIFKGSFGMFTDITERRLAEDALRKREFELNESQRMAHIGSWDWDARKDIITWSPEYYRIYNIDPKLPTPNYLDHLKVYTPESAKKLDAAVGITMKTGKLYELELELKNPDEKRHWVFAKGEAKYDSNGQIVGLRGTAQNITERKRAEEVLKKSELILKRTQHLAKVGGWEYDIEKKKISWSDEVYNIYGVSPEEYDPNDVKRDIQFYTLEDRETIERAFNNAVNDGIPYDLHIRFVNASGKNLWVRTMGEVEKKDGKLVRVFGNIMDITDMKTIQEKLHKLNEELEKRIKDRTVELEKKNAELERLNRVFVGRELRMIELKKQIKELEKEIEDLKKPVENQDKGSGIQ